MQVEDANRTKNDLDTYSPIGYITNITMKHRRKYD